MDLLEDFEEEYDSEELLDQENGEKGQGIDSLIENFRDIIWNGQDVDNLKQVLDKESDIVAEIALDASNSVGKLSMVVPLVRNELELMYECICKLYEPRFGELQGLVSSAEKYVRAVEILEKCSEPSEVKLESVLSKEEVLVVSMSIKRGFNKSIKIKLDELQKAIGYFNRLNDMKNNLESWLISKIERIAPNTSALVGPEVTSRLISHCGGIKELSRVPSCNLASIGKSKTPFHGINTDMSGVRQQGVVFQSELVQSLPIPYQKKALRMVCAKVSLAARSDCAKDADGHLGLKWRQEILDTLLKIMEPPNIGYVKPLPIPEDAPKKKRAGRRFRKYKQQFQLSHLRQMQNRMVFGKEEEVVMDAFGDEIGFGMANSRNVSALSSTHNNKTKLKKDTIKRLAHEHSETSKFLQDERSQALKRSASSIEIIPNETSFKPKQKKIDKQDEEDNDWFTKHL